MERNKESRRKCFKSWYLTNRKSEKEYTQYEDFGRDIKSVPDGYYTLLRMIFENSKDDLKCFETGKPPAGAMGAHKRKDGSYKYTGVLKKDPIKEWNDSLILDLIKDAL